MKGHIVENADGRLLVSAQSTAGIIISAACSAAGSGGTPMLLEDGKVLALVHGHSKHRARAAHSASGVGGVTPFVYCDFVDVSVKP